MHGRWTPRVAPNKSFVPPCGLRWKNPGYATGVEYVTRINWLEFGENPCKCSQVMPLCMLGLFVRRITQKVIE